MAATLPNPPPTLFGAIKNIGRGIYQRTAKFAGYGAAVPTATTAQGSRIGTNPNSTSASVQRVGMQFTAEMVAKNSAIGAAYLAQRVNYCSSSIDYVPHTGDTGLDREIKQYLQGSDGVGGYFSTMGVDCSMQDAFSRTADIETPVRGDAGLIFWRDALDNLRLIEFSADQLGEVYQFTMPRPCSIARDAIGQLYECSGNDCIYFAGRYFRGADCIAYKIYERTNAWYGNPQIYDADDVIYFRDPASFRGVRGVTKFANALQHMQKGEDMLQAALSAAQRQARTAGRVFNNSGGPASGYGSEVIQGDPTLGGDMIKYFEREPGGPMVEYFYNGDNAEFVNPTAPGPELIAGVEVNDERVAIALGLNYAFLISATKVGGAPSRLEIEKADKELQRIQRTIHRPRLNTIRDRVLMDAMRRGEIRKPFGMTKEQFLRGNWQLPISPSVDAFYDAKENISMVRAGMEAAQDVIAETNRNWEDVLEKNAQWAMKCSMVRQDANKKLIEAGYKPDITPADIAQVSDNPQQSAAAENIEQKKPAAGGSQTQATAQQTAQFAEHDVSDEKRDKSGRWTSGGGDSFIKHKNTADSLDYIQKNKKQLQPELTLSEADAVASYQSGDYQRINPYLRGELGDEDLEDYDKSTIHDLDSATKKGSLPNDTVLFRSGVPMQNFSLLSKGDTFTDTAFVSTSFSPEDAFGHTSGAKLEIRAKKGTAGALIQGDDRYTKEAEWLLPKNSKFRILEKNGKNIIVEIL